MLLLQRVAGKFSRYCGNLQQLMVCAVLFCLQTVFVATEVAAWSKVGGLSDVMAALPRSLASRSAPTLTKLDHRETGP